VAIVHYADDFVMGFASVADARRCWPTSRIGWSNSACLHEDKTRLIGFGR
jgi:hypothetical protein